MESSVWQQSPILDDILKNGHRYHFHQLMVLLESLLCDKKTDSLNRRIRVRPDTSLAFPAADIRRVAPIDRIRFEVVVRFMGLYGVDSPLPQYFSDEVTEQDTSGKQLQAFLDIFNQRLYGLLHQAWKRSQPTSELAENDLHSRLTNAIAGQYWQADPDAIPSGGFIGCGTNVESLEDVLQHALNIAELTLDPSAISWLEIERGFELNGQQALGVDVCVGNAIAVMGRKVSVQVGPVEQEVGQAFKPGEPQGQKMANILFKFLPEGVDFDVVIKMKPKLTQAWQVGSAACALGVSTVLGSPNANHITLAVQSQQYKPAVAN